MNELTKGIHSVLQYVPSSWLQICSVRKTRECSASVLYLGKRVRRLSFGSGIIQAEKALESPGGLERVNS